MNVPQRRAVESLVSALCDGVIDGEQLEQLEGMLRRSAECRQLYLQFIDMHARLTVHPNLASGIPIDLGDRADADAMLVELAGESLDRFDHESEGSGKRRRLSPTIGRWTALSLVMLFAIVGWRLYDQRRNNAGGSTALAEPVIRDVIGEATLTIFHGSSPARIGPRLTRGGRLQLGNDDARVLLEYDDGTSIAVYSQSVVEVPVAGDVQLRLVSGMMQVNAVPQRKDRPLVFATEHARYVVLGTRFRLYGETESSRLELDEGTVRLERKVDGKEVDVRAGQVAVATSTTTPIDVQPLALGRSRLSTTLPKAGRAAAFSFAGDALVTAHRGHGLKRWIPGETTPTHRYDAGVGRSSGLVLRDDVVVEVTSDRKAGHVTLWRPGEARARTISLPGRNVRSRSLAAGGEYVAESGDDGTHVYRIDTARAKRERIATLPDNGKAWCLALSEQARFVAAGFWDGTVRVYSLNEEKKIVFEQRLSHTPTKIAVSPDGDLLAVFSQKDGLVLIDLANGKQRTLMGNATSVASLDFTSNGERLTAGLRDRTARMWSAVDGRMLLVIDAGHVPHGIAFSTEAKTGLLVTAGGDVKIWECKLP